MDLKSDVLTLQNQCPKVNPSVSKISLPLHPEMIFPRWFHPCGLKMSSKDDSSPLISSLRIKILSQRWFSLADFIPAEKNPLPEMILPSWFHPCGKKSSSRDDSSPLISSLPTKILFQRWFILADFIPADKNSLPEMILPCWFYPCFCHQCIPSRIFRWMGMHSLGRSHPGADRL